MKRFYWFFLFTCIFSLILIEGKAQIQEDFETGSVNYVGGSFGIADLSSGNWTFSNASIGTSDSDKKRGDRSARLDARDGKTAQITFTGGKDDGTSAIRFYYAAYGDDPGGDLQVSYSTDGGDTFVQAGSSFSADQNLRLGQVVLNTEDTVQVQFTATGGGRINIDDVTMLDIIEPEAEPTLDVFADGIRFSNEDVFLFEAIKTQDSAVVSLEIRNRSIEPLTLDTVYVEGEAFDFTPVGETELGFLEAVIVQLKFNPDEGGTYLGAVHVENTSVNSPDYVLNVRGRAVDEGDVYPVSLARKQETGSEVTVSGRVTVANQFGGPAFMQDETAGIAVFDFGLHQSAEIGDSVVVTGELGYPPFAEGNLEDYLLQLTGNVNYEIIDTESKEVQPTLISIEEMNTGDYEGQLVLIQNTTINHAGPFSENTNYDISDGTGSSSLRINENTNLVGAIAPDEAVNIIGVIDQFDGNYQLLPRFTDDLGVEELTYPGEDISKDDTFEIVTWNIEWFGDTNNGPSNESLQLENVKTVIDSIDADIFAFQEISNGSRFLDLVDDLEEYGGVLANFTQDQRTAFLFKRATIDSLDSGLITSGMNEFDWANGRYPLFFRFNASINGMEQEVFAYNIHAKAFGDSESRDRREDASEQLKEYLDSTRPAENVIFLGDYNDLVTSSTAGGADSPYKNFVDDPEYTVISQALEEKGFSSYASSGSMIDHITISSELTDEYFQDTERVENTGLYINDYLDTTSDHYPVWVRFRFSEVISNEGEEGLPKSITLSQNYPNPFNPSTVINYQLTVSSEVSLKVYDLLGREVTTLVDGRKTAGEHQVRFDASNLSSGVYIYKLTTESGTQLTKKMVLMK